MKCKAMNDGGEGHGSQHAAQQMSSRSPQKSSQRVHKGNVPAASRCSTGLHDAMDS